MKSYLHEETRIKIPTLVFKTVAKNESTIITYRVYNKNIKKKKKEKRRKRRRRRRRRMILTTNGEIGKRKRRRRRRKLCVKMTNLNDERSGL